jgi:hypothetical protein
VNLKVTELELNDKQSLYSTLKLQWLFGHDGVFRKCIEGGL